ncbi:MAG: arylsulfatase [Planctomycetota bacterium]|nr:arylsulfatase [Planctomycetota bacterium]
MHPCHLIRAVPVFVLLLAGLAYSTSPCRADDRPNIIVIMVDDMGWSDLGCYGGEIRTPNIDGLAGGGLRFTSFYNTARCCPTRASLLTGLYPHQAGLGRMTFDAGKPGYRGFLTANTVTIPEVLRQAGYRTAMVGKWHLSLTESPGDHMKFLNNQAIRKRFSDPATYPVSRGFEEHYGIIWGVTSFFDPYSLVHNLEPVRELPKDYYITDAFSDHAVEYVEKYSRGKEPFFLYLAYTAPHWPLHALPEDIKKYEDTYKVGWDVIRKARFKRLVEMGLLDKESARLSDRIRPEKKWENNPRAEWDAQAMAVHAAMIDRVDQGVGRLVGKLKELKIFDNTLILFLSDNGASPEEPRRPGFDRNSETRDGRKVHYYGPKDPRKILPGPETTYSGFGPMWANAANTPFRHWKARNHEGGVATPLIAHWPKGLKAKAGSITHEPGHVIDIMATCVDLAKTKYPGKYKGRDITPVEGKSLAPIFSEGKRRGHEAIYFEHYGNRAIRKGDWKLVALGGKPWELFNLANDRSETVDLSARHPGRVKELDNLWNSWAKTSKVFPRP